MHRRIALIAVTLAAAAAPPAAAAGDLVLSAGDVAALEPAGTGAGVARKALPGSLPRALRGARTQGAAFTGAGRRLRTGAFVAGSEARARRALRGLAKGMSRLKGLGYARTRSSGSSVTATVVLRAGRAIGVVRYSAPKRLTRAGTAAAAKAYATVLAARMDSALSRTAWDRAMDGIREDGSVRPGTAIKAFAIAYGSIPGAKRPARRAGAPADGTLAAQLVARSWDDLTSAQRRAIERKLGTPHTGAAKAVAHASQDDTPDPALQAAADQYAAFYSARMGIPAPVIDVYTTAEEIVGDDGTMAAGEALPEDDAGGWSGPPVSCRIRISPTGQQASANALADTVAHEVFHCFQFTRADWTVLSPWILEGMAAWAASVAAGTEPENVMYAYAPYLEAPDQHLFTRDYDGIGFWGWAEQAGGADQLWSRLPAILTDATSANAFAAAGGADPGFLDGWASATFRYPKTGGAWNQVRPFPVPYTEQAPPATVVDADADLESVGYALRQYLVVEDPSKPLVQVQRAAGHLRAGTEQEDFGPVGQDWFCFGDCTCPKGQASTVPIHRPVGQPLLSLGQTGGAAAGKGSVAYHALDAFCSEPGTGVTVSGATDFSISEPGYCVRPFPGVFQVQMPVSAGGQKVFQVVLEVAGFTGAGTYHTGPSVATVYDFRKGPAHLWETPESGDITIQDPGGAAGEGAFGTVTSSTTGTSVDLGTTQVKVSGAWRCRG